MATPSTLLRSIGMAVAAYLHNRPATRSLAEGIGDIAAWAWSNWTREADELARRLELEMLARAEGGDVEAVVNDVTASVSRGLSPETSRCIASYLILVPATVRQALKRMTDPAGTSVSERLVPQGGQDLLRFLPVRIPVFRIGDKPLPGVDWKLVELLGIGGSGEVWKATNASFRCVPPVALKFCVDPDDRDRYFRHEAALLSRAMPQGDHPGLVALRNTYLGANPPCLEYEFVEGGDLGSMILEWRHQGKKIPPMRATRIMYRLAKIVGHFHRCKPPIVHRDLKPANILIRRKGPKSFDLKIADFGIGGLAADREIELTRTGMTRGHLLSSAIRGAHTPLYASPEQVRGNAPDPRDDVHALGVIWYQMLVADLTQGAPTGLDWLGDLIDQGMTNEQVRLVASCFATKADRRSQDAMVLSEKILALFPEAILKKKLKRSRRDAPPPPIFPEPSSFSSASEVAAIPLPAPESEGPSGFPEIAVAIAVEPEFAPSDPLVSVVADPLLSMADEARMDQARVKPASLNGGAGHWKIEDQGMSYTGKLGRDPAEMRRLIARMRALGGKPAVLGDQLETAVLTRYISKQLIWVLSKWCHERGPARDLAQQAARRIFDQIPPQFLNLHNQPVPDQPTADQEYLRWRDSICLRGESPASPASP